MKKEIKIVVAGECMSGKSSILYLLKQLFLFLFSYYYFIYILNYNF